MTREEWEKFVALDDLREDLVEVEFSYEETKAEGLWYSSRVWERKMEELSEEKKEIIAKIRKLTGQRYPEYRPISRLYD